MDTKMFSDKKNIDGDSKKRIQIMMIESSVRFLLLFFHSATYHYEITTRSAKHLGCNLQWKLLQSHQSSVHISFSVKFSMHRFWMYLHFFYPVFTLFTPFFTEDNSSPVHLHWNLSIFIQWVTGISVKLMITIKINIVIKRSIVICYLLLHTPFFRKSTQ